MDNKYTKITLMTQIDVPPPPPAKKQKQNKTKQKKKRNLAVVTTLEESNDLVGLGLVLREIMRN